ncbi:GTP cyclohydrolase IIa [Sulfurisphaera ohwakuensis]|uniref:GTP cyclohydrolase IIa n=1 Tax=Sulfurisphaera ohwakuensis TaxID=69656 RepID=UPI0036F3F239
MKIMQINLVDYKEWTESLGYDREWKIQNFQHGFLSRLNEIAAEINSFIITYRYDSYIMLLDGVLIGKNDYILTKIKELSPVPIDICFGYGKTLLDAERNCSINMDNILLAKDEKVLVAHFDLDGFSRKRFLFDAYLEVYKIYNKLFNYAMELGGLAYYLGGDNIGIFLGVDNINKVIELANSFPNMKVGIGIGNNPREALKNAAEALHIIRIYRDRKIEIVDSKN